MNHYGKRRVLISILTTVVAASAIVVAYNLFVWDDMDGTGRIVVNGILGACIFIIAVLSLVIFWR